MRRAATFTLLLAAACTGEWVRDYPGYLPDPNWEERVGSVVVDARTGQPLAGVAVRLFREVIDHAKPVAPFVAEFATDEYGVFTVVWSQAYYDCHWVYGHPGYAPQDFYAEIPDVVELKPGRHVRGRLLDAAGRPAAGIEVEHFAACVHSPTVRRATTDADGWYTLRNVEPGQDFPWALVPGTADYSLATLEPVPGYE
ncbi:MAG: carboxypeptidase-like regulatory domain-containing protein [Planctomycetota bacterium]